MSVSAVFGAGRIGAQSQYVLGAYFPSWMLCALAALAITAAIRWIFVKVGVDRSLPVPLVIYLALTVAFSLGGWLLWPG
jgi:YtcA family